MFSQGRNDDFMASTSYHNIISVPFWINLVCRGATKFDGARGNEQVWRPRVRTWGLSEANTVCCRLLKEVPYLWPGLWSRKSRHPTPTPGNFDYPTPTPTPIPTPDRLRPPAVLVTYLKW